MKGLTRLSANCIQEVPDQLICAIEAVEDPSVSRRKLPTDTRRVFASTDIASTDAATSSDAAALGWVVEQSTLTALEICAKPEACFVVAEEIFRARPETL